jgi:hypothetical protein
MNTHHEQTQQRNPWHRTDAILVQFARICLIAMAWLPIVAFTSLYPKMAQILDPIERKDTNSVLIRIFLESTRAHSQAVSVFLVSCIVSLVILDGWIWHTWKFNSRKWFFLLLVVAIGLFFCLMINMAYDKPLRALSDAMDKT